VAEKEKFYSFEEALKELRLKEEELKRLVSEGEIRAFRDGDTMKLRKSDVETLRSELTGVEVVDLGEGKEELVFEDDAAMPDETGMATEAIADVDTIIEDDVEDVGEIQIEEEVPVAAAPVATRRPAARRTTAVVEVEENEGAGLRIAAVITTLILVLALPLTFSASSGSASGIAKTIASLFGHTLP